MSPQVVKLNFLSGETVSGRLDLQKVISPEKDKLETLYRLLCTLGDRSTLVFVNYRESVERTVAYLKSKKFPCDAFHGGMEQDDRERALYKFRNGSCPVLVSTDLAARGLDIPGIDNVVHYHMPVTKKPLRTVTDARHAGKHAARLSCFCMPKSVCPIIFRRALRIRIAGADAETCQTPLDYLIYRQRQERQTEQGGHCGLPV